MSIKILFFGLIIIILISGITILVFSGDDDASDEIISSIDQDSFGVSENRDVSRIPIPSVFVDGNDEEDTEEYDVVGVSSFDSAPIQQIFSNSVAGFRVETKDGGVSIKLIESGTGYYYEINDNPYSVTRLSNSLIPRTVRSEILAEDVIFIQNFERQLEDALETFMLSFSETEEGSYSATGSAFENYLEVTSSPEGDRVFYLLERGDGVSGVVFTPSTNSRDVIWTSDLKSWTASWEKEDIITLSRKPSYSASGVVYELDLNGNISKIAEGFSVSSITSSNPNRYLIYENNEGDLGNLTFNVSELSVEAPFLTLPEKCAWLTNGVVCGVPANINSGTLSGLPSVIPDSWYQGDTIFNDHVYVFNPPAQSAVLVVNPNDFGYFVDIIEPVLYENTYLFFLHKTDRSLWVVKLF